MKGKVGSVLTLDGRVHPQSPRRAPPLATEAGLIRAGGLHGSMLPFFLQNQNVRHQRSAGGGEEDGER